MIRTLADRKDKNQGNFDDFKSIGEFLPIFFIAVPCSISTMIRMTEFEKRRNSGTACRATAIDQDLFRRKRPMHSSQVMNIQRLHGDGSSRRFFRIGLKGKSLCLAVAPATAEGNDLAEAESGGNDRSAPSRQGVFRFPAIYGWQEESGLILFEDLGDTRLHDLARSGS